MAVFPSPDSATDQPCDAPPMFLPTSFSPCWLHTPRAERVNTHAALTKPPLSEGPPTMAVFASADSATEKPCSARPMVLPTSFWPCCLHTPRAERVNTHAAPTAPPPTVLS
jgi:hypothetical protein